MYCIRMLLDMHTLDFLDYTHNMYLQTPRSLFTVIRQIVCIFTTKNIVVQF